MRNNHDRVIVQLELDDSSGQSRQGILNRIALCLNGAKPGGFGATVLAPLVWEFAVPAQTEEAEAVKVLNAVSTKGFSEDGLTSEWCFTDSVTVCWFDAYRPGPRHLVGTVNSEPNAAMLPTVHVEDFVENAQGHIQAFADPLALVAAVRKKPVYIEYVVDGTLHRKRIRLSVPPAGTKNARGWLMIEADQALPP